MNVFSADVKNIKLFKSLLSILKDLLIDISFIITKNKIRIVSLDSSKEILLNINIDSGYFNDYICLVDKIIINTGAQNLYKIISKISNKTHLNLSIRDKDYNEGFVTFLTLNINENFIQIKLNENNINEIDIPSEEPNKQFTQFTMKSSDLYYVIKNMDSISDFLFLRVNLDHILFESNGIYASSKMVFPNNIIQLEIDSIIIPIEILKKIAKSIILSDQILIKFGKNTPFNISYNIPDLGDFQFYYRNIKSL